MTPQAHVAALNALHLSIRIQANKLAGVLSTVKVPDDEAAKASLQGVLKGALRPPGSWASLVDGAELEPTVVHVILGSKVFSEKPHLGIEKPSPGDLGPISPQVGISGHFLPHLGITRSRNARLGIMLRVRPKKSHLTLRR